MKKRVLVRNITALCSTALFFKTSLFCVCVQVSLLFATSMSLYCTHKRVAVCTFTLCIFCLCGCFCFGVACVFVCVHACFLSETIIAFKGHADIRQYVPSKPHRFGYKIFALSSDAYILQMRLSLGVDMKKRGKREKGKTHALVMEMIRPYLHGNYILYTDNYFTSIALTHELAQYGIATCSSARLDRTGMPPPTQINEKVLKSLKKHRLMHFQKDNINLILWRDNNIMKLIFNHIQLNTALTTIQRWGDDHAKHDVHIHPALKDYYYHSHSVDIVNQYLYAYPIARRSKKAWSNLAWGLIDLAIVQAYRLHRTGRPSARHVDFRIQLYSELAQAHLKEKGAHAESVAGARGVALAKDHYSTRAHSQKDCVVCSHQPDHRVTTTYVCAACGVHLCIGECFRSYHSKLT